MSGTLVLMALICVQVIISISSVKVFYPNGAGTRLDIYGVIQWLEGHITPSTNNRGGKNQNHVHFNWVNGRENVKGKINIAAKLELTRLL